MLPGGLEAAHNAPLRQRPLAQRCCAWTFAPHFQKFCSAMQRNTFMPTARSRDTEVAGSCRPRRLPQSSGHCARPVLPLGLEQRRACTRASAGTLAVRGGKPFAGANQGTTLQRSRCSADCAPRNLPRAPPPPRSCALETRAPQRRNTPKTSRTAISQRISVRNLVFPKVRQMKKHPVLIPAPTKSKKTVVDCFLFSITKTKSLFSKKISRIFRLPFVHLIIAHSRTASMSPTPAACHYYLPVDFVLCPYLTHTNGIMSRARIP